MIYLQVLANGLVLGGLYAAIAVGFSLVWGVLNVINLLHGSFIILGAYVAFFGYALFGVHPFLSAPLAGFILFAIGYSLQATVINRVIHAPVLMTLTLTFGLDLLLNNAMLLAFKADYRKVVLDPPLGSIFLGPIVKPLDRIAVMIRALLMTYGLYRLLRDSKLGRAIIAIRMDREAAALMGVNVLQMQAMTFAIGAFMAGAAGSLLSIIYPISPLNSITFLGKAFVICVIGGLGSVGGAIVGGITLGLLESLTALWFGPEYAVPISFALLVAFLAVRPTGLLGRRGYE
jgi:branched-chain amino acid transport system permease protein